MTNRFTKPNSDNPNLKLWDEFFTTQATFTKQFNRKGGFKGTAVNTMYVVERLTDKFGPFGQGWGIEQKDVKIVPVNNGEILVYVLVGIWYKVGDATHVAGYQWGGDSCAISNKDGIRSDDEAMKKASTDGMLKCAAWLGIGGDIHYGLHDDQKYLNYIEREYSKKKDGQKGNGTKADAPDAPPPAKERRIIDVRNDIVAQLRTMGMAESEAISIADNHLTMASEKLSNEGITDAKVRKARGVELLEQVLEVLKNPPTSE